MIVTRSIQPLFGPALVAAVAMLATPVDGALAQDADTTGVLRIDLPSALRLADERNLDVAIYVERVAEATAKLTQARMLAVPSARAPTVITELCKRRAATSSTRIAWLASAASARAPSALATCPSRDFR